MESRRISGGIFEQKERRRCLCVRMDLWGGQEQCGILADQPVPLSSPVSIYKKIKEAANIYLCNVSLDLP